LTPVRCSCSNQRQRATHMRPDTAARPAQRVPCRHRYVRRMIPHLLAAAKAVLFAILSMLKRRPQGHPPRPFSAYLSAGPILQSSRGMTDACRAPWSRPRRGGRGLGRCDPCRNQSVQAPEGRRRFRRRRATAILTEAVKRRRAVRKERGPRCRAPSSMMKLVTAEWCPRRQSRAHQADRRIPDQRERLAAGGAPRAARPCSQPSQQGLGGRTPARRDHPERNERLYRAGRG